MIQVSEEIQLTCASVKDAPEVFKAIDGNRQSLRTWLPFVDFTQSRQDGEEFLKGLPRSDERVWIIRYKGAFAGVIGLKSPDEVNHKIEIGYWIIPACEGKGIVTTSCRALIEHAFESLQMNRILIQVATGNTKSQRIPERLGFTREGIERDGELLVSGYTDIIRYGLLKREYNGIN